MSGLTFHVPQNPKHKSIKVNVFTTGMDGDDSTWTAQNAPFLVLQVTHPQLPVVHYLGWSCWVLQSQACPEPHAWFIPLVLFAFQCISGQSILSSPPCSEMKNISVLNLLKCCSVGKGETKPWAYEVNMVPTDGVYPCWKKRQNPHQVQ